MFSLYAHKKMDMWGGGSYFIIYSTDFINVIVSTLINMLISISNVEGFLVDYNSHEICLNSHDSQPSASGIYFIKKKEASRIFQNFLFIRRYWCDY